MKVLLTGAAGFIGSNLMHHLVAQRPSWEITALDALTYAGNLENLSSLLKDKRAGFVKADITDEEAIRSLFEANPFDLVFHLAAESHVDRSIFSAREFMRTNVQGTQILLDAFRVTSHQKLGTKARFVHISTDEVYGSLGSTGYFYETTPLDPTSPYAASKAASDLIVLAFHKTHGLNTVITRCTNNYGPYQFPEKFIPLFITNAVENKKLPLYGDGMNVRSWLHVSDHCEALLRAAEGGASGEVYNFGGGHDGEIPNIDVAKRIIKILGKPESMIERVTDRLAHDRRYAVDHAKATESLGWKPTIAFEQGLESTVQWYLNNEEWWRRIKSGEYQKFYELNYQTRLSGGALLG